MDTTEETLHSQSPLTERPRLEIVDAAKGMAACIIVGHHLCEYSPSSDTADRFAPNLLYAIYNYGLFAVYFFLVFGGFSLAWSTSKRPISWRNTGYAFLSRYLRLVVPYLVMLVLLLISYYFGIGSRIEPRLVDSFSWWQFVAHLFFLQDLLGYGNFSAGTWYLCIDMQYVAFFLVLQAASNTLIKAFFRNAQTETLMTLCLFPLGLISIWVWSRDQANDTLLCFFLGPIVLGALIAWEWKNKIPAWVVLLYVAGVVASLIVELRPRVVIGLLAAILIWFDLRFGRRLRVHPGLLWLGKISYSLFLIHYLVNGLVLHGLNAWIGESPFRAFAAMIIAAMTSLSAAAALYRWIEAPCNRWVKSIELSKSKKWSLPLVSSRTPEFLR